MTSPHGDEAKAAVHGAQIVKALEQIARGIGVVPVVAAVVDGDVVAGFLRERPRILDQIVAREQDLEDRIAKGRVLAGHGGSGSDAAAGAASALASWARKADASSCCRAIRAGLCARRKRGPTAGIFGARSYFAISSRTSATVE